MSVYFSRSELAFANGSVIEVADMTPACGAVVDGWFSGCDGDCPAVVGTVEVETDDVGRLVVDCVFGGLDCFVEEGKRSEPIDVGISDDNFNPEDLDVDTPSLPEEGAGAH